MPYPVRMMRRCLGGRAGTSCGVTRENEREDVSRATARGAKQQVVNVKYPINAATMADSGDFEATSTGEAQQAATDQSWDLDAEWAQMRVEAGLPPEPDFIAGQRPIPAFEATMAPMFLLYTGFFLGPAVTLLVAFLLLTRKPTLRQVALMASAAATAWLLIQGLTLFATGLDPLVLRVARSICNLGLGAFFLVYVRAITPGLLVITRHSLAQTLGASVLVIALYAFLTPEMLMWMGR